MKENWHERGRASLIAPLDLPMRFFSKVTKIAWESQLTN